MNLIRKIIVIVYFLWINTLCIAQENSIIYDHTLDINDGLSANYYLDVLEDSRGIVWMSSQYGLDRYDGVEIKNYLAQDYGFEHDYVDRIVEDPNANIWLRCLPFQHSEEYQFSILNPITEKVYSLSDYFKTIAVSFPFKIKEVFQLNDGGFYIQTIDNDIYKFDGQTFKIANTLREGSDFPIGIIDNFVISVTWKLKLFQKISFCWQKKGKSSEGGCYVSANGHDIVQILVPQNSKFIYWIEQEFFDGYFLLHFYKKSLSGVPVKIRSQKIYSKIPQYDLIWGNRDFYVIGNEQYLFYYNSTGILINKIALKNDTPFDFHNLLFVNDRKEIWKRDREKGGIRYINYHTPLFNSYQLFDEWSGLRGILKKGNTLHLSPILGMNRNPLTDFKLQVHVNSGGITDNKKGELLLAWEDPINGLSIHDYDGKLKKKYGREKYEGAFVNTIPFQDKGGTIWLGGNQGLHYLDTIEDVLLPLEDYNGFNELRSSIVYHFHPQGELLWLATSAGLYLLDKNRRFIDRFHKKGDSIHCLPNNNIVHIHEDKEGIFWLASKGGGLIKFNPKTKQNKQYNLSEGLVNNVIYAVYEDAYQHLWMSSNYGIMRFDKKSEQINNYTMEHGLLDNEFNTLAHHQDTAGLIYFGSQLGLIILNPKDFLHQEKDYNVPIVLSEAKVFSKTNTQSINILENLIKFNKIELDYDKKGFEIKVVLPDYRHPKFHQYAYKVEGYDQEWVHQKNSFIKLNNLPYGNYKLDIKIKNLDGFWVKLQQPITITVLKPFYLKTWFFILVVAFLLALFYAGTKWREQHLLVRQRELEKIIEKRTEKISQQAEDLKALNQVQSRFFANITHEFRTPLTLILGPLSKLMKLRQDESIKQSLAIIKKNSEHLLMLIEEILDLSKLEAQRLDLEENKVHFATFIRVIYSGFKSEAEDREIDYKLNLNIPEDLYLLLDSNKVEKILNNLLSNAIKFTLTRQSILLEVNDLKESIEIIVEDKGQGIHPNDLPYVFDRFYQSKQPDRPAQGGTGIGLALVSEFTKMMQGSINVVSKVNEGTTFILKFPKQVVMLSEEEKLLFLEKMEVEEDNVLLERATSLPKNKTILLVEDHPEMRLFVSSVLDSFYNIIVAKNGKEGLLQIQNNISKIDLIISDVMMPEMDGFTMLEYIKSKPIWRSIPIIMLTARAAEKDKLRALTIGVHDYITKPFSVDELLARSHNLIQNATERQKWLENQENSSEKTNAVLLIEDGELEWMQELERLIIKQLKNGAVNILELSKEMFISERQFRRKIKKITGLSPQKLVNEIRMKIARNRLESGDVSTILNLAIESGFKSTSSFIRAFKKHFGKTPTEFLG